MARIAPPIHSLWLLLLLSWAVGCGIRPDLDVSRNFQNAEQAFAKAETPDDFMRVAGLYQEIIDSGFVSGSVLYNQGNAWMRAGERGRAIASYRRARRFLPRDVYLNANLQNALTERPTPTNNSIVNYVFFWQDTLSYREKLVLTTVILVATVLMGLLSQFSLIPTVSKRVAVALSCLFLLSAISVGRDWYRYDRTQHGVIVVDESIARKGNAKSYDPAFTSPLTEGTEFVVVEHRDDWIRARIGDAGDGWLPANDCAIY